MAIGFIQYPSMISPENVNLDKTKLIFFIITKIKMSTIQIDQGVEILRTRYSELAFLNIVILLESSIT